MECFITVNVLEKKWDCFTVACSDRFFGDSFMGVSKTLQRELSQHSHGEWFSLQTLK